MDVGEYIRRKQRAAQSQTEQSIKKENGASGKMSATEAIDRYSGMNEEQLMQELFRVGKVSDGNVSAKELDAFFNTVKSFLTPEQSAKMRELILQLKQQ